MQDAVLSVRILTTAGAAGRQERMRRTIGSAFGLRSVPWDFFMAIPHGDAGLTYDEFRSYAAKGRTLSPAELSCYASHVKIIEDWLQEAPSQVLFVIEDDVYVDPYYDFIAAAQLAVDLKLDYLRLYSRAAMPARLIAYHGRTQLVRFTWSPSGTQSYMLTRAGAERLIRAVRADSVIVRPIDDLADRYWQTGNAVYGLFPSPIIEHNLPTTIHAPDQMKLRRESQAAVEARRATGFGARLEGRSRQLAEKFARLSGERAMQRHDRDLAPAALAYLRDGFKHLRCLEPEIPPVVEIVPPPSPAGESAAQVA